MDEGRRYALWLAFTAGQNPLRHAEFLSEYGDARAVFLAASTGGISAAWRGGEKTAALMKQKANEWYIDRCVEYLAANRIKPVLLNDANYPELLREIDQPPPVLFVKGELPQKTPLPIAVIGSRACSDYGRDAARRLSGELAQNGACIISGMAYGVDKIASEAALEHSRGGCPTIAVLGCGVDVAYPPDNRALYDELCERAAVVSEFLPGTKPEAFNFPRRNRIISGMSRGVLVVEAAMKSGTRITVDCALEQGRDVFAVPGRITDAMSEGTNEMIRAGMAKPVFSVADILEEYGITPELAQKAAGVDESALSLEEALIVRLLMAGERSADELCEMTGFSPAKINSTLTGMEFSGIIKQSSGRVYSLQGRKNESEVK